AKLGKGLTSDAVFIWVQPMRIPRSCRLIERLGFFLGLKVRAVTVRALGVIGTGITCVRPLSGSPLAPLVFVESLIRRIPRTLPDPDLLLLRGSLRIGSCGNSATCPHPDKTNSAISNNTQR